jgi:hypothetical protein
VSQHGRPAVDGLFSCGHVPSSFFIAKQISSRHPIARIIPKDGYQWFEAGLASKSRTDA